MLKKNPQNKYFILSKRFAFAQDIFGMIAFVLAIVQGITLLIPANIFLVYIKCNFSGRVYIIVL